jgi:DNA-binding LacI/PurR family transcriptional regulator
MLFDKRMWVISGSPGLPIYRKIEALILAHIQAGRLKPGDLVPSYPWLSKALRVADKTVRQAYANLEREGVLVIVRGKGTYVASGGTEPKGGGQGTLGVLLPVLPLRSSGEAVFWRMLRGTVEAASAAQLPVVLGTGGGVEERRKAAAEGWVVWEVPAQGLPPALSLAQRFVVLVGAVTWEAGLGCGRVQLDYAGAARGLAYRLVGLGHRRIGLLRSGGFAGDQAESGYRHALGAAGLAVEPAWLGQVDMDVGETGLAVADTLLAEKCTAVLACGEGLARVTCEAAARRGVTIPQGLSLAALVEAPPVPLPGGVTLEAALLDAAELGRRAVQLITEAWATPEGAPRQEIIAGRSLEGTSVAPLGPALPAGPMEGSPQP